MRKYSGFAVLAILLWLTPVRAGQVHVGQCNESQDCTLIIHAVTDDEVPGINVAGVGWKVVLIDAGIASINSILSDSMINSATEKANIENGDVLEIVVPYVSLNGVANAGSTPDKISAMDVLTDRLRDEQITIWQRTHNWYGYQQPPQ